MKETLKWPSNFLIALYIYFVYLESEERWQIATVMYLKQVQSFQPYRTNQAVENIMNSHFSSFRLNRNFSFKTLRDISR